MGRTTVKEFFGGIRDEWEGLSWDNVVKTPEYQDLPVLPKIIIQNNYFNSVIVKSSKYKSFSKERQNKIKDSFFTTNSERDGFDRDYVTNNILNPEKPMANAAAIFAIKTGDKFVDTMADRLAGYDKMTAGRTTPEMLLKDLPRSMVAEFTRFYKPSTVLTVQAAAPILKTLLKHPAKFLWKRVPNKIKNFLFKEFTVGKGLPTVYTGAKKEAGLAIQAGGREAQEVYKTLTTEPFTKKLLSGKEQRIVGRIFRKEAEGIRHLPKYSEYSAIAKEGRTVMDKWSKALIKSGVPSKEAQVVIDENVGSYMGRMFTSKLKQNIHSRFGTKYMKLRLDGLKHRKDLSTDVLKQMGEIKEPALPTALRVRELSTTVANAKLFNTVAKNPEWVASSNVTGKLIKMPDTATMGALRGKWVVPNIAEDINAITQIQTQNLADAMYSKALSAWKFGKVVLNPSTHARNMLSNSMLLDFSGTNHLTQLRLMPGVLREYITKGPLYQRALKSGAIGGEFVGAEVSRIKDFYLRGKGGNLTRWFNVLKAPFRTAANVYQGEEQIAKLVKFSHMVEKGATDTIAAEQAQKWLFNYNEIPNIVKYIKKSPIGAPFITFTYKAIPRVAETLVNNPLKLYKYYALFNSINTSSQKMLNMSPTEFAREQKALPPWLLRDIGGMPTTLLMPWKDKHNRTQWLNLEYILPLGMGPEIAQRGILRGGMSNPLKTFFDLANNRDFRGQDIVPIGSTKAEANKFMLEYTYRQLAPSLVPALGDIKGGYSWEKMAAAISKRPDYMGRTREVPPVIFDVLFGLKLTPLDVRESEMFKMHQKQQTLKGIYSQAYKLYHPSISEEEREKGMDSLYKKMGKIIEE